MELKGVIKKWERDAPPFCHIARHSNSLASHILTRPCPIQNFWFLMVRTQLKPTVSFRSRNDRTLPYVLRVG